MKEGKILSINTSDKKGIPKKPVDSAVLVEGLGIEGDAHAAPGIRQVSLLAQEDIDRFALKKICIKHGDFGENITTQGIDLFSLEIGTRLRIGEAVVEVSKKGKECHAPCHIGRTMGKCVMPERGIFAVVVRGGKIMAGDIITKI